MENSIDLNEMFKSNGFKLASPVKKLNYNNNPKAIIGMYLISSDNYKEIINNKIDANNITYNTILFFEQRHLFDIGSILLGMFYSIKYSNTEDIDPESIVCMLLNIISNKYNTYRTIKNYIYDISQSLIKKTELRERVMYILENIWFIGYDGIDSLMQEAVDVYNKETNNESTD